MATNITFGGSKRASLVATDPATPASGDPVICGQIPGIALDNEAAAGGLIGQTTVGLDDVAAFSVKGIDGSGNSAVAVGDILYYVSADTPKLSKKDTGVRFGYARQLLATGTTGTIDVQIGY